MSGPRQTIQYTQQRLALASARRGEPLAADRPGTEPPTAKRTTDRPATEDQLMEEVCDRSNLERVRLFFVGGPISLSGGGEAGGNWIRQGVVRSGGGSGGRRYFCRQRPMGDFRWSSRAS